MSTEVFYLDADHNVVAPEDAEIVVTTELDADGVVITETWEELISELPTTQELRRARLKALIPVFAGVAVLVAALLVSVTGGATALVLGTGAVGLGATVWGLVRTI
jgi:hypothetical protein